MRIALAFLLVGCVASNSTPSPDPWDPTGGIGTGTGEGTGTSGGEGAGTGEGSGSGTGEGSGSGELPEPPAPVATGVYAVRSDLDLTVEVALPQMAADAVGTLRDFQANPARTLFDLAEAAGVPAVATIRDYLPDYLESKLEGWINDEIAQLAIGGVPVTELAGSVVALAETALTQFAIDSELAIDGTSATHTLKALDLTPAGLDARYALDVLPADVISATATCSSKDGTLAIGDHGFAIPYGEYVWRALDASFEAQFGTDIRATLGAAVNCPALAQVVASKCYWSVCVGHAAELTQICEAGLDEAVERAYDKVAEMRFDVVHFAAGTAQLVDADENGDAEALTGGVWTAEINAGMGLRPVPATFTATK